MPGGYAGKFLEVDLTGRKIKDTRLDAATLEMFFGGRGLAAKILWDRLGEKWRNIDPLGPENLLIAITGPMTGIYPGGRICVSGKSPMSNGTVGSTASTEFAHELKCAGYDGVIVSGKADEPVYIEVTDDNGEIKPAKHLWGMNGEEILIALNREVCAELTKRKPLVGLWKEPGMIYIGPAGENLVRNAAVMSKLCHACGYGGYGSVMGSKNLKAIVAKGRGRMPSPDSLETAKIMWKRTHEHLIARTQFRRWGTGYGGYGNGTSSEPIRNWQEEWHEEKGVGGPMFETRFWVKKKWTDFNCTTNCMKVSCIKSGPWKGDITDMPDYELEAHCGTNFGIFNAEEIVHLSTLCDLLGHSGINGMSAISYAAELYQRGILTEDDIGFKLEWGDVNAFDRFMRMVANREGIGDVIAEGTYRAAIKIAEMKKMKPEELLKYAVVVKGIEVGAHGTRSDADFAHDIGYAASVQGGDHSSLVYDGYTDMSGSIFADSGVFCSFAYNGVPQELVFDFAKAITGFPISIESWRRVTGPRIITLQKVLLLLGGPDATWEPLRDDDNPPRFYEPLPSGPFKGRTTDKAVVDKKMQVYFETLGWDERGIPEKDTLKRMGLDKCEAAMQKLRL